MFSVFKQKNRNLVFAAISCAGILSSLLIYIVAAYQLNAYALKSYERGLFTQLKVSKVGFVASIDRGPEAIASQIENIQSISGVTASVLLADDPELNQPEIVAAGNAVKGVSQRFDDKLQKAMYYMAIPIYRDENNTQFMGYLRFGLPTKELSLVKWNLFWLFAGLSFLSILSAYLISARLVNQIETPLVQESTEKASMKQSELDEILKEKEKIETMLSSFGAPFVVADIGGKIIEANELYQNIFGSVEKAHEVKKPLLKAIKKSFEQDQPVSEELQFGEPINRAFIVQINLVKDALGVANQAAAVMHDVTSRIKFEELQEEFLKGISQALKSPIASISAGAETLLARSDMSQESAPLLLKIKAQSERMAKLLNDILYLSSLDNSHPQFNKVKLNDIVQGAIKDVHAGNGRKKIKLENLVSPEIEVWADSAKIAQAIYNLLDNAHKFTEDGGVIQVDAAKHNGVVEIAVIDNGAGIKKEDLPHLFERFYQPQSNGSVKGTTGLGLAIVKHIIEMHQGKIWAESEPGWWSKFYFTLKSVDSPQPR